MTLTVCMQQVLSPKAVVIIYILIVARHMPYKNKSNGKHYCNKSDECPCVVDILICRNEVVRSLNENRKYKRQHAVNRFMPTLSAEKTRQGAALNKVCLINCRT